MQYSYEMGTKKSSLASFCESRKSSEYKVKYSNNGCSDQHTTRTTKSMVKEHEKDKATTSTAWVLVAIPH